MVVQGPAARARARIPELSFRATREDAASRVAAAISETMRETSFKCGAARATNALRFVNVTGSSLSADPGAGGGARGTTMGPPAEAAHHDDTAGHR